MDKISDFFSELKNRFSSPLFSSFIISWLIFNWKVPVVLFFYSERQIQADGFISYNNYISNIVTGKKAFLFPFIFAALYTILYPFIKEGVKNISVYAERIGTDLSRSISKKAHIPMERYLSMQNKISEKEKELEVLIGTESQLKDENNILKETIDSKDGTINSMKEQIEAISERLSAADSTNQSNGKLISQYETQIGRLKFKIDPNYIQGAWKIQQLNSPIYYAFISGDKGFFYQYGPSPAYDEFKIVTFSHGMINQEAMISFFLNSLERDYSPMRFNLFHAFSIESYTDDHTPPEMRTIQSTPWKMRSISQPKITWTRENEPPIEVKDRISQFKDKHVHQIS